MTSLAEHGPFNAVEHANVRRDALDTRWVVTHPSNGVILGYYESREDAEAAVALHSAAPAMLALLEELVNADLLDPDDEFTQSIEDVIARVRASARLAVKQSCCIHGCDKEATVRRGGGVVFWFCAEHDAEERAEVPS